MSNEEPNPNEEPEFKINFSDEDIEAIRQIHSAAKHDFELSEAARTRPVNMRSREDMMFHMLSAHEAIDHISLQFYDEGEHGRIPALRNRKRDWSGEMAPALDEQDIRNWHHHDHTDSESASYYPHTTMGDEHFHH